MIQSNYLPWRGYFDFIDDVDLFVIYDDVQYTRKDWRNRNKIKTVSGTQWITVPVIFSLKQPITVMEARVDYEQPWQRKHIGNIIQAYRNAPYLADYADELFAIIERRFATISELNIALIRWVMEKLDIQVPIDFSKRIKSGGDRNQRILNILHELGASEYLVGPKAQAYIDEEGYRQEGIALVYKSYNYMKYPQLHGPFEGAVTVLDLLFNCGPESRLYLKSTEANRRAA